MSAFSSSAENFFVALPPFTISANDSDFFDFACEIVELRPTSSPAGTPIAGITDDYDGDPRKYLSWWVSKRRQELTAPPKRIIDLEKESTVLLMTALETIGDQYGIYGFSGYGRDNVEFFVIKDFNENQKNNATIIKQFIEALFVRIEQRLKASLAKIKGVTNLFTLISDNSHYFEKEKSVLQTLTELQVSRLYGKGCGRY